MRESYQVNYRKALKWWVIEIPAIGGHTQARRRNEVEYMARDYVALWFDVAEDSFDVVLTEA